MCANPTSKKKKRPFIYFKNDLNPQINQKQIYIYPSLKNRTKSVKAFDTNVTKPCVWIGWLKQKSFQEASKTVQGRCTLSVSIYLNLNYLNLVYLFVPFVHGGSQYNTIYSKTRKQEYIKSTGYLFIVYSFCVCTQSKTAQLIPFSCL